MFRIHFNFYGYEHNFFSTKLILFISKPIEIIFCSIRINTYVLTLDTGLYASIESEGRDDL